MMTYHSADNDFRTPWPIGEGIALVALCRMAFDARNRIKNENIAQECLVSLLIEPRD